MVDEIKYMAIGTDASGKFVFKEVTPEEMDKMAGADDNICYLNYRNFEELVKKILRDCGGIDDYEQN